MANKKVSVVITILNEQDSIKNLLISLFHQSKVPDEIIIIDAGSTDQTLNIVHGFKRKKIKLLVKKGISRSNARNLGVKKAINNIIAMTDAGCVAQKNWLKNITQPFKYIDDNKQLVVAGFYNMVPTFPKTHVMYSVQQCFAVFLGTLPQDYDKKRFLPSTRSIAFTKSTWKAVGGFPTKMTDTAEDTLFNQELLKKNIEIKRTKNARVEWSMPESFSEFFSKISKYAKGDVKSKKLIMKEKGIESHNIKVVLVFSRYLIALISVCYFIFIRYFPAVVLVLFFSYVFFAFLKVFRKQKRVKVAIWGPLVQFICDAAVMLGFIQGII